MMMLPYRHVHVFPIKEARKDISYLILSNAVIRKFNRQSTIKLIIFQSVMSKTFLNLTGLQFMTPVFEFWFVSSVDVVRLLLLAKVCVFLYVRMSPFNRFSSTRVLN